LNDDQPGEIVASSKSSMNASACVFARTRVPLFAQTPVVGIPLSMPPPLEDPPLEDPLPDDPLPDDPPLEELLLEDPPLDELLEEPLPLEELLPLEEPPPEEPLPLDVVLPLEDPPPEELPPPGEPPLEEPPLAAELVPLEEPAPDKPASVTRGGLKSMFEVPEHPELSKKVTVATALTFALWVPLDFKPRTPFPVSDPRAQGESRAFAVRRSTSARASRITHDSPGVT
jgi:hypothetical protein